MLKQQTTESGDPPVAQIRVKREEFARAISALEARRQAEAQYLEGTVAVEDTLRELHVDASTEEVMQQIEAQRVGLTMEEKPCRVWDRDKIIDRNLIASIVLVPLLMILLCTLFYHPFATPGSALQAGNSEAPLAMLSPSMIPVGVTESQMDEGGFNASSILKPLSQVPDNQPVHCNTRSLEALFSSDGGLARNEPLNSTVLAGSNQEFDVRPDLRKPWILIKHEGNLYLRAWVAVKFTKAQVQGHFVTLHSSPRSFDPGVQTVPITLPVSFRPYFGSFVLSPFGLYTASSLGVSQVNMDQHAWEKW